MENGARLRRRRWWFLRSSARRRGVPCQRSGCRCGRPPTMPLAPSGSEHNHPTTRPPQNGVGVRRGGGVLEDDDRVTRDGDGDEDPGHRRDFGAPYTRHVDDRPGSLVSPLSVGTTLDGAPVLDLKRLHAFASSPPRRAGVRRRNSCWSPVPGRRSPHRFLARSARQHNVSLKPLEGAQIVGREQCLADAETRRASRTVRASISAYSAPAKNITPHCTKPASPPISSANC